MSNMITILNFSPRTNGNCEQITQYIKDFHSESIVKIYHIESNVTPCSACDYECLKPGSVCPGITDYLRELMQDICASERAYYIVPNFCGYPNATFFAFNERRVALMKETRAVYPGIEKKFIIVSNTESECFAQAMRQQVAGDPDMLYLKSGKYKKQSTAGDILTSQEAQADLKAFLESKASV